MTKEDDLLCEIHDLIVELKHVVDEIELNRFRNAFEELQNQTGTIETMIEDYENALT